MRINLHEAMLLTILLFVAIWLGAPLFNKYLGSRIGVTV